MIDNMRYIPEHEQRYDVIASPKHYLSRDVRCKQCDAQIEPRHVIEDFPFTEACIIQYVWRYKEKGGIEDLRKAQQYLVWLIENYEKKTRRK